MHLLDTDILLELLLNQKRAEEVPQLLRTTPSGRLFRSDPALHSIGISLFRRKDVERFSEAITVWFLSGEVGLVLLELRDMQTVAHIAERFNLDFDDDYQYAAAEKLDLTIVSFDADFDRTERGRKTPADLLAHSYGEKNPALFD